MDDKKLIIIDGNSSVHRAYHALPPLTDARGRLVNAVFGFMKMLRKIINSENPSHILVAFDHEEPTFRHADYSRYKSQRARTDSELIEQFPVIYKMLDLLKIRHLSFEGYEADDIIASFARQAWRKNIPVVIITGDKDILQIVSDGIRVVDGMKDKSYDSEGVKEKLGVKPEFVSDYIALVGDKSDNLPGVRGIGPVTAVKLISKYGDLGSIYSSLEYIDENIRKKLEKNKENAYLTRRLATLVENLDLDIIIDDCSWKGPDTEALRAELKKLNFNSLISDWVDKDELIGKLNINLIRNSGELELLAKEGKSFNEVFLEVFEDAGEPVGFGISFDGRECFYVPTGHKYLSAGKQIESYAAADFICEKITGKLPVCSYDFKKVYRNLNSKRENELIPAFDCITADYVLSGKAGKRNLKDIAAKYLEWVPPEVTLNFSEMEIEKAARVVSTRINALFKLKKLLEKEMEKTDVYDLYINVELPLLRILSEMEITGIRIDCGMFEKVEKELNGELREVEKAVFKAAGEQFNINSSRQLARIMFHKLGLEPVRKTKTGYSTADDVLEELKEVHPLPELVRTYRGLQKLLSTYIKPLPRAMDEETGRIHTTFNITGTSTGRLSSTNPNLQNIPVRTKKGTSVRESFPAAEGHLFLSADYSQIDLRALAHISGDKNLIESFREGEDIHTRTAALVFGVDEKKVSREMRNKAKAVNFGIVYGMSAWGLEKRIEGLNKKESEEFIEKYFSTYPKVEEYMENIVKQACKKEYVKTVLNRRRYLPEIKSSNYIRRKSSERMAINTPIQGSSADIIKKAMVDLDKEFKFNRREVKLLLQIHDELIFEIPRGREEKFQEIIKRKMENAVNLDVPLKVEFKKGESWGTLEKC